MDMKKVFGILTGLCLLSGGAGAVSVMTSSGTTSVDTARTATAQTDTSNRGNSGLADAYRTNQRNTYYLVTKPDVDTACRNKIYECLSNYCGDTTVVPGQRGNNCDYATESELYNAALLCLQKDTDSLLSSFSTSYNAGGKGMN